MSFRVSHYAYKELKAETGYESAELWIIDLAQISSVIDFAERFEKDGGRIDILLLNAGIIPAAGQQLTEDGYEPVSVIRFISLNMMPNPFFYHQISGQQLVLFPSCSSSTSNYASHRRESPHKSKDSCCFERTPLPG